MKGGKKWKEEWNEVDGDEVHRIDPKAAVIEMLKKAKLDEDIKNKQEKKRTLGKLSLNEKKRNREIWRMGMLDRVKKENVPVEHWGSIRSGNFKIMIGQCAPSRVRIAVVKELGSHKVDEWLYKELMKFYDKR